MPTPLTQSEKALHRGLEILQRQHPAAFKVEGLDEYSFIGSCEEVRLSDELGEGGFTPTLSATFYVRPAEFAKYGHQIEPYEGMRITFWNRLFVVTGITPNPYRWTLTLGVPQPRDQADRAQHVRTLRFQAGHVLSSPGNHPFTPTFGIL
jgi:hypothetical protein